MSVLYFLFLFINIKFVSRYIQIRLQDELIIEFPDQIYDPI